MRKRIILSLISIFAFVFFSCSGLLNDVDENSSSTKAYVQIGDTSSRTVLPNALTTADMTNIKLFGVKDGESSELLSANTYSELSGKTKEIEAGTWSFSLSATINGNTFTDSTSCTNTEVNAGQTVSLTFTAMETSATTGDFRVTVNFVGTADEVYVALNGVPLSSSTDYTVENNVVTVSKSNVEAGDHYLSIQFSNNNVVLNTFDEIVSVEGGCTSEATYDINLNELYSISVNTIVGGTVMASSTSAMAGTEITLTAAPKNTGFEFSAWNVTDASGTAVTVTDNKFTMPASNVTVSATFIDKSLYPSTFAISIIQTGMFGDTEERFIFARDTGKTTYSLTDYRGTIDADWRSEIILTVNNGNTRTLKLVNSSDTIVVNLANNTYKLNGSITILNYWRENGTELSSNWTIDSN